MTDSSDTRQQGDQPNDDEDMPLPTNPQSVFLGGLFTLALLATLYVAAEVVLPVILALILKLLLQPLVRFLERFYVPRFVGALISVLLVLAVIGGAATMLAAPAASWATKLPQAIPQLRDQLSILKQPIDLIQDASRQVQELTGGKASASEPGAGIRPGSLVSTVFSSTATITSGLFTTLLVLFYLLMSGETFLRRMVEILPRFHDKRAAVELSAHVEKDVSAYLLTVSCINVLVGLATAGEMWLCGMPTPLLWGAVAFALNFMPILGPMIGVVIFLGAGVLSLGVSWWAVLPAGVYLCIHIAEGEVATPMLLSKRFTINPVAMIVALIVCYWMWGVIGAVLAMPLLAIIKIICDDLRPLRAIGHLLEG